LSRSVNPPGRRRDGTEKKKKRDKERKRENERAMGWDSERKTDRKGR
jgi:hypothetical protein